MKTKSRGKSILAVLVVIVLLLVVASTVAANVIFSGDKVPKIGDYYLYLHETNDMEPDIAQNTLILAKDAPNTSLSEGSKVLCYLSDGTMALRCIYSITVNEDGSTNYFPGTALDQGSELVIPRTNIFAICEWQSKELYSFIKLATSVTGLMLLLIIPCVILIIMLLVKIARSGGDVVDEDDFMFDDVEIMTSKRPASNPLFEPGQAVNPDATVSLERKKSSISENFQRKTVDTDSPYQKAVQERTMKFRIQQQDIEEAAKQQNASMQGTQIFSTQTVEETAKRQLQEYQSAPLTSAPRIEAPRTTSAPVNTAPAKSNAPNIDDVVSPSELRAAKNGQKINSHIAATDSIDDLLRVLEAEKNKL